MSIKSTRIAEQVRRPETASDDNDEVRGSRLTHNGPMRRPEDRPRAINTPSPCGGDAQVARLPGSGWAVAASLVALGLQLSACSTQRVTTQWYEVVSHSPGPEVTDATMRRRIEESEQPWKVRNRATGVEMVLVMPGEFLMGSPEPEPGRNADESPQHRVRLSKAFYLGMTEVTQAQWQRVMKSNQGFFSGASKPVDASWDDLQSFLAKANAGIQAGVQPLRAPTEAEWEYACRAGTTGPFSFEGPPRHDVLNCNDGVVKSPYVDGKLKVLDGKLEVQWETPPSPGCRMSTAAAGSLPANAWGLHEMHGNLWEWTSDKYSPDAYKGRGSVAVDPIQRAVGDDARTLRGGDWYKSAHHSRSAVRDEGATHIRSNRVGFRVARTL